MKIRLVNERFVYILFLLLYLYIPFKNIVFVKMMMKCLEYILCTHASKLVCIDHS